MKTTDAQLVQSKSRRDPRDLAAAGLSFLCLLHCLALPTIAVMMPAVAILGDSEWLHAVLVLMAVPLSLGVVFRSHRTGGDLRLVALILIGLALLVAGAFLEAVSAYETHITVVGAVLLGAAHIRRWWTARTQTPPGNPASG